MCYLEQTRCAHLITESSPIILCGLSDFEDTLLASMLNCVDNPVRLNFD